ncbi:RDD family protein [Pseudoxanthomonas sp. 10H]|uniref:RDD family protein n=1 Tax=Pseudoxanthomonas sp. 10H TaxID=3242729 RepID=UPI003557EF0D
MPAQEAAGHGAAARRGAVPMLDTYREVLTPEGVSLHLPAAGPVPRALAWLVDLAVRAAIVLALAMVLGVLGGLGEGLYLVGLFLVSWAYPIVLEAAWNGQTPGKRALGLRVVAGDGAPVGWLPAVVRNLMRTVDMLPFGYATGLVACLCDRDGRRLGDLVADTVVVHVLPRPAGVQLSPTVPRAPARRLLPDEQAALVAFGERASHLSAGRQAELAALLYPLTGSAGDEGVRRLHGIAAWLLGRR